MVSIIKGVTSVNMARGTQIIKDSMKMGLRVADLRKPKSKIENELEFLSDQAKSVFDIKNLRSSQQVLKALKENLEPLQYSLLEGSTAADKLDMVMDESGLVKLVKKYRLTKKSLDDINQIMDNTVRKEFISPTIEHQKSWRLSYLNPGLMTLRNDTLWDIILPPTDEYDLYSFDIKNQESWILVNMLKLDFIKKEMDESAGVYLYEAIFKSIFNRLPNEKERADIKTAWLALPYGASSYTMDKLVHIDGSRVLEFFNSIPEYAKYKKEASQKANKKIQTTHSYFGTEMYAGKTGGELKRSLMSLPIQGTGADIMYILLCHLDDVIKENGVSDRCIIYFSRLDEIILAIKKGEHQEKLVKLMEDNIVHKVDDWDTFTIKTKKIEPSGVL